MHDITANPDLWTLRLLLCGLALLSVGPVLFDRFLALSGIYNIRFAGGLHPADLLALRWIGEVALIFPFVFAGALVLSVVSRKLTSAVLTVSVGLFVLYLTIYLFQTTVVISMHVPK
jgi:hypothetical protein